MMQNLADDDSGDDSQESDDYYEDDSRRKSDDSSSDEDEFVADSVDSSTSKSDDPITSNNPSGVLVGRGWRGGTRGRGRQGRGRGARINRDVDNSVIANKARDGTVWHDIDPGAAAVRQTPSQNILRETPGPAAHAKRNIVADCTVSAFSLLIDEALLKNIQMATQQEAHRQLGNNEWSMSLEEVNAFIAILYARGAFGSNTLVAKDLWDKTWGPIFFCCSHESQPVS